MIFRVIRFSALLLAYVLLVTCTAGPTKTPTPPSINKIVWPSPPAKARVTFLQSFHEPQDLNIHPSAFRRFMSSIAGKKDTGMVKPYAISVYQQTILVGE